MNNSVHNTNRNIRRGSTFTVSSMQSQMQIASRTDLLNMVDKSLQHLKVSTESNIYQMEHLIDLLKCKTTIKSKKIRQIYDTLSQNKGNEIYFEKTKEQLLKYNYNSDQSIYRVYVRLIEKMTTKIVYYLSNSQYLTFLAPSMLQITKKLQVCLRRINNMRDPQLLFEMIGKFFQENKHIEEKIYEVLVNKGYLLSIEEFYTINGVDLQHRQLFNKKQEKTQQDQENTVIQGQITKKTQKVWTHKKLIHKNTKQDNVINKAAEINCQIKQRLSAIIINMAEMNKKGLQTINQENQDKVIQYDKQSDSRQSDRWESSYQRIQRQEDQKQQIKKPVIFQRKQKKNFTSFISSGFSKILSSVNDQKLEKQAEKAIISIESQIYEKIGRKNRSNKISGFMTLESSSQRNSKKSNFQNLIKQQIINSYLNNFSSKRIQTGSQLEVQLKQSASSLGKSKQNLSINNIQFQKPINLETQKLREVFISQFGVNNNVAKKRVILNNQINTKNQNQKQTVNSQYQNNLKQQNIKNKRQIKIKMGCGQFYFKSQKKLKQRILDQFKHLSQHKNKIQKKNTLQIYKKKQSSFKKLKRSGFIGQNVKQNKINYHHEHDYIDQSINTQSINTSNRLNKKINTQYCSHRFYNKIIRQQQKINCFGSLHHSYSARPGELKFRVYDTRRKIFIR